MSRTNRRARAARSVGARTNAQLHATGGQSADDTSLQATAAAAALDAPMYQGARFTAVERSGQLDIEPGCPFAVVETETGQVPENWFGQPQRGYHRTRQHAEQEATHLNELAERFQPTGVSAVEATLQPSLNIDDALQPTEATPSDGTKSTQDTVDLTADNGSTDADDDGVTDSVRIGAIRPMLGEKPGAWEQFLLTRTAEQPVIDGNELQSAPAVDTMLPEPAGQSVPGVAQDTSGDVDAGELPGVTALRHTMVELLPRGVAAVLEVDTRASMLSVRSASHGFGDTVEQVFDLQDAEETRDAYPFAAAPTAGPRDDSARTVQLPKIFDGEHGRAAGAAAAWPPMTSARLFDGDAETVRRQVGDEVEHQGVRRIAAVSLALDGETATTAAAHLLVEPGQPIAPNVVIKALMDTAYDVRPSLQQIAPELIDAGQLVLCSDGSWRTTAGGTLQDGVAVLLMADGTEHAYMGAVQFWVRDPQRTAAPAGSERPPCPNSCTLTSDQVHRCRCPFSCGCAPHPDGPPRQARTRRTRRPEPIPAGA